MDIFRLRMESISGGRCIWRGISGFELFRKIIGLEGVDAGERVGFAADESLGLLAWSCLLAFDASDGGELD